MEILRVSQRHLYSLRGAPISVCFAFICDLFQALRTGRDGTGRTNTPGLNRTSRGLSYGPEQLRAWNGLILQILEEAAKFILGVYVPGWLSQRAI